VGQGYQAVGQQLHSPPLAAFRWFALGDRCQDRFDLVIDFWKTAGSRALIQRKVKATYYKLASGS